MTRTSDTINLINSAVSTDLAATGVLTTIDSTLVTAGLTITDFFNVRDNFSFIQVYNSDSSAHNITIKNGAYYPQSKAGDLTISVGATKTLLIPIDSSARFQQADGALYVDFATGFTGTIGAFGFQTALNY